MSSPVLDARAKSPNDLQAHSCESCTNGFSQLVSAALAEGQARFHGVTLSELREAETVKGREFDPRVSAEQLDAFAGIYCMAQHRFFSGLEERQRSAKGLKVLFAPTARVVDHMADERALSIFAQRILAEGKGRELIDGIDKGPPNGAVVWDNPANEVELIASVLRWSILREGDKKRLRVGNELRGWMLESLQNQGYDTRPKLGGLTAVGTALAPTLGHTPTMFSLGSMPPEILAHLPADTAVVGSDPQAQTLRLLPVEEGACGNFSISFHGRPLVLPPELHRISIGGVSYQPEEVTGLDIIVSGGSYQQGFSGIPQHRMKQLGGEHELMVLTGLQVLASDAEIHDYFDHVETVHRQGIPIALLYSETKFPQAEAEVWAELRRRAVVEFIGMNTAEAWDILARMVKSASEGNPLELSSEQVTELQAALKLGQPEHTPWGSGREGPEWLFHGARLIQEILDIPLVRVRGRVSEVLVVGRDVVVSEPEAVRDSMIVARNMGTLKVANQTGLIDEDHEVEFLRNLPHGKHLAALHRIADELKEYNNGETALSSNFALSGIGRLRDGRCCFAIPPVPFYERHGGTQSAGDTIDSTFVMEQGDRLLKAARLSREKI